MMELKGFGHLHTHSEYSLLDGMSKVKELLKRAKQYMGPKSLMLQIEADKELGRI